MEAFDAVPVGSEVTTDTILDYVASHPEVVGILSPSSSSNPREFTASIELASYHTQLSLDFANGPLGDYGLQVSESTPLNLEFDLDLNFSFGLTSEGTFYAANPTVFGRVHLDHDTPLSVAVTLGPLGIGIENGSIQFEAGLGFGTSGRLDINTLNGDVKGSLLGSPRLDSEASYNMYLPVVLEGACWRVWSNIRPSSKAPTEAEARIPVSRT